MEEGEYLYSGNTWLRERWDGREGHLWRKARGLFIFRQDLSSALNLFKFDYKAVKTISRPEGTVIIGSDKTRLDPNQPTDQRPGKSWTDDAQNSIRTLLDRIVTRWRPDYLYHERIKTPVLHHSLTPVPIQYVQTIYDKTDDDINTFNVKKALETYKACLVPLHYHELWSEIVNDYKNVDMKLKERETIIDVALIYNQTTLDEEEDGALIFGTNRVTYTDNYKALSKKLGLFDIVLITANDKKYFGMIVHVEQIKVEEAREDQQSAQDFTIATNHSLLEVKLHTTIGVYVSQDCADVIKEYRETTRDNKLGMVKLSNITSSRRMISAIHSLQEWSQYPSLLKPTIGDIYFQTPEGYDPLDISPADGFNMAQSKTIAIAECTGKSRTIAGIVLKLLSKLPESGRKQKILLCAPSNNACDELSRRILDEFKTQHIEYKPGTLVRIGCRPPDDYRLCDHFLDFMVLKDLVDILKVEQKPSSNIAQETETHIMRRAKIVVSTLNYCASTRMHLLKSSTAFIIIDEASQSLEADFLLPLRFKCKKLILVGDPKQLPPCVLSSAGNEYGLSQSLYSRLYSVFEQYTNGPISTLTTQYRMHSHICHFPSEYFYSNQLLTDKSVDERMKNFTLKPLFLYDLTRSPHSSDAAGSSFNVGEAKSIQYFCNLLISHIARQPTVVVSNTDDDDDQSSITSASNPTTDSDDDEEEVEEIPIANDDLRSIAVQKRIAVITPYRAQVRHLRSYLPPYVEVMTVDSSQGKEKDIVIVSCVRSGGTIGFLDDMNRVNVLLTRSKYALYIFGNLRQLANQHGSWRGLFDHARLRKIICYLDSDPLELPYRE